MRRKTYSTLAMAVCLFVLVTGAAAAGEAPVNKSLIGGVAIKGYDPVAYFTESKPVKGSKAHQAEWNGAKWRFSSAANRELFEADPEKYAPAYGGYCAWAISQGYTAGIDPAAFRIVDDRLYLNYSRKVQLTWEQDIPGNIAKADANYPEIIGGDGS